MRIRTAQRNLSVPASPSHLPFCKGEAQRVRRKLQSTLNLAANPLRQLLAQLPPPLIVRGTTRAGFEAPGFAVNFRKNRCFPPGGAEPRPYQI